ncbi:MAG: transglutaminase-like domain-containing protein [Victivallaceae bacterium]
MSETRKSALMAAAIILPAGCFFSIAADLPHVFLLTLLLIGGVCLRKNPLPLNDRSVIYLVLALLVLTVLFDQMFPLRSDRFSFLAQLVRPEWIVPLLCYGAVLSALFGKRELTVGLAAGAALAALSFGGDIQNSAARLQRLPELSGVLGRLRILYPSLLVLTVWSSLFFLIAPRRRRIRWELTLLLLIPLTVLGMYAAYLKYESEVRAFENFLFRVGMRRIQNLMPAERVFSANQVNLHETLSDELRRNEAQVVIEAVGAKGPPGYLRGRIYTLYQDGVWQNRDAETARELPRDSAGEMLGTHLFSLFAEVPPAGRRGNSFEMFVSRNLKTDLLYHSAEAETFEMIADRVQIEPSGTLRMRDWESSGGLRVYFGEAGKKEFTADGRRSEFLQLPRRVRDDLGVILQKNGISEKLSFQEKTDKLLKYFAAGFSYSRDFRPDPDDDPVIEFLTRRRAGHCELFASALTLLLRRAGVPARYVTGFVCEEPGLLRGSYLARLGNAHAWVEAFDRKSGAWVLLEPTPPTPPIAGRTGESLRRYLDAGSLLLARLFAHLKRGTVAGWVFTATSLLAQVPWWCYSIMAAAGAAGWFWFRRRRRRVENPAKARLIHAYYRKLEKLRRAGLLGGEAEPTANELAELLQEKEFDGRERLLRQLSIYRKLRYKAR